MANTTPLNDGFADALKNYSKDQTDNYSALLGYKAPGGIVNPYTLYELPPKFSLPQVT